jgi:hypothetical protein
MESPGGSRYPADQLTIIVLSNQQQIIGNNMEAILSGKIFGDE